MRTADEMKLTDGAFPMNSSKSYGRSPQSDHPIHDHNRVLLNVMDFVLVGGHNCGTPATVFRNGLKYELHLWFRVCTLVGDMSALA